MDIVRIESKLATTAVSRLISKAITKSTGCSTDLKLHSVDIRHGEGEDLIVQADVNASVSIPPDKLEELVKDLL